MRSCWRIRGCCARCGLVGWVLRDVSRQRPELVRAALREHGDAMSGVTKREAIKYV